MLIRSERPGDIEPIDLLTARAFERPENGRPPEVGLIRALRGSKAWIPQLSLVAEIDDDLVGHCLTTRAKVEDSPVLALGPIAVDPLLQRGGIGSALMRTTIDIACEMSESLIGLLGDPDFYERFGFVPASKVGIEAPDPNWGDYFQVRVLDEGRFPRGAFAYPDAFGAVS